MKVLVVEDEAPLRELIIMRLQREGFEVFAAENGRQGYELCVQEKPDVILLDILMPEMDGYEVAKAIRANDATKGAIIIAVSAKAELIDKRIAIEAGVDTYLTKPVIFDEVIQTIQNYVGQKKGV